MPRPAGPAAARATRKPASRAVRYPRNVAAPVLVEVHRGTIVESRHRGHVVQVAASGEVERAIGDPEVPVTLRSAVKPFALVALIESGAADDLGLSDPELAVMAASHMGEDKHVRTLQAVFRRAGLSQSMLACGSVGMPMDKVTAMRLARDGEAPGPIRHQCSGFHAASLLLSRFSDWSLDDYDQPEHPSQFAVRTAVAKVFGVEVDELDTAVDDCGLGTYAFPLVDVARAYALLADPTAASDTVRVALAPALTRVRDAMTSAPEMVGGTEGSLDTMLMQQLAGKVVSKGGAEGLRGIGILPGARGSGRPAMGIAVRIEDGDGFARANRAVTMEALTQLGIVDERARRALSAQHRPVTRSLAGDIVAETIPDFQLAPISELG
ncbi:MAG: asparaginase [Chloroflexi bacterium]|nr:asparaginase [Chloroflexota bacterium]